MNLLQKIYSKLEKKVNEVLMTRKFNAFIESELVEREEKKEKHLDIMKSRLETGHFSDAFIYYSFYLDVNNDIERLKAFKDFVLSEKDNTKN
jgi:hypothetical protein